MHTHTLSLSTTPADEGDYRRGERSTRAVDASRVCASKRFPGFKRRVTVPRPTMFDEHLIVLISMHAEMQDPFLTQLNENVHTGYSGCGLSTIMIYISSTYSTR